MTTNVKKGKTDYGFQITALDGVKSTLWSADETEELAREKLIKNLKYAIEQLEAK